jgi:hypothetical protein
MNFTNKNICLTSRSTIMVIIALLISTLVLASVLAPSTVPAIIEEEDEVTEEEVWVPTKEDIEYQDSMFCIIEQTQQDVDTIKQDIDAILYKLDRLEYKDGTSDSIRYVKGGPINRKRN